MTQTDSYQMNSPTRALLWKEWRQQRLVFLTLSIIPPLVFLSLLMISHFIASLVALFFFCAIPVVLGASAFCAEDDDQTGRFLNTVPVSRATVFWVKARMLLMLNCAAAVGLVLIMLAVTASIPANDRLGLESSIHAGLFTVLFAVIATPTTAIISVLAKRTISCILATVTVLALAVFWIALILMALGGQVHGNDVLAIPLACLILVTTLLVAGSRWLWCWAKQSRPLRTRIVRVLLIALLFALITGGLAVRRYVHITFFTPLNHFTRDAPSARRISGSAHVMTCTPDGKTAIIRCRTRLWENRSRCAIVDVESGEWRWLSRLHEGYIFPLHRDGAQSSDYLMFASSQEWLWPFRAANPMAWLRRGEQEDYSPFSVIDIKTGNTQALSSLCPDLPSYRPSYLYSEAGWLKRNVFAVCHNRGGFFANVEDGTVVKCDFIPDVKGATLEDSRWHTNRGVFAQISSSVMTDEAHGVQLARFAPNLPVAEITALSFNGYMPYVQKVSSNGRWCLTTAGPNSSYDAEECMYYLCSLETGEAFLLRAPETAEMQGPITGGVNAYGFILDGNTLLIRTGDGLVLFDAETHEQRIISLPDADPAKSIRWSAQVSPSGKYALNILTIKPETTGLTRPGALEYQYCVANLATGELTMLGESKPFIETLLWSGDEKLIWQTDAGFWIMNRDGTDRQPLLKEDR